MSGARCQSKHSGVLLASTEWFTSVQRTVKLFNAVIYADRRSCILSRAHGWPAMNKKWLKTFLRHILNSHMKNSRIGFTKCGVFVEGSFFRFSENGNSEREKRSNGLMWYETRSRLEISLIFCTLTKKRSLRGHYEKLKNFHWLNGKWFYFTECRQRRHYIIITVTESHPVRMKIDDLRNGLRIIFSNNI